MPVYLFWGEEEFNLENAVLELRQKTVDPAWAALNHKMLDEPDLTDLIEALQTLPMAFGNILIEVKATSLFLRGNKKATASDALMKKLIDILETLNANVHVLFICPIPRDTGKKIDSVLKITKTIEKIGKVEHFEAFKFYQEDKIVSWIMQRAGSKGIKITKDAASALVQNTGAELRKLDSELDKLKLSVYPNKSVKLENVLALCATHENIFLLADYWIQNDTAKAFIELHKLFEKDHALRIIATLQTIVKKWLKIKVESKTKDAFEISRIINQHKFVIEKDLQKLRNVPLSRLVELRKKLTDAEYKIKTGEMEAVLSLELVIAS